MRLKLTTTALAVGYCCVSGKNRISFIAQKLSLAAALMTFLLTDVSESTVSLWLASKFAVYTVPVTDLAGRYVLYCGRIPFPRISEK